MTRLNRQQRLLRQLIAAMGASAFVTAPLIACGGDVTTFDGGSGGAGGSGASGSTGNGTTTNGSTSVTTTTSGTGGGFTTSSGSGGATCHDLFTSASEIVPNDVDCDYPADQGTAYMCFAPVNGECSQLAPDCIQDIACNALGVGVQLHCGPLKDPAGCCYVLTEYCVVPGRPFTIGHEIRTASAATRDDWNSTDCTASAPQCTDLTATSRAALAAMWQRDGLAEHASIASFSRFVLQLLAQGAPAALVARAQQAVADELEHARICFAMASAYAQRPVGPGPLDVGGALADGMDAASIAASVIAEGAIGETIAALLAAAARDNAEDPAVRAGLSRIADDEAAHAALAWSYLGWALQHGGEDVRQRMAQAFDEALASGAQPCEPDPRGIDIAAVRRHGYLSAGERERIARDALSQVIAPARDALFARPSSERNFAAAPLSVLG